MGGPSHLRLWQILPIHPHTAEFFRAWGRGGGNTLHCVTQMGSQVEVPAALQSCDLSAGFRPHPAFSTFAPGEEPGAM